MNNTNNIISVVIPVYNSADTLEELNNRLVLLLEDLVGPQYEIIFVNDGSTDSSWKLLRQIASEKEKVIAINLTRNFGQHNALMCGFSQARGIYVVTIDDDLQIPPEEIAKIFEEIQSGYDIVYGVYGQKQHSAFRNFSSRLLQYFYRKTFNIDLGITSFRIIRQEIVQFILNYEKSFTYIDGLIAWFTKNIGNVNVEHQKRRTGTSGYSLKNLIMLALNMLTNFSIVPLQLASLTGFAFSLAGFFLGTYFLLKKIFWGISVSGFSSIIVAITMFSGVQLLTIGILGEYIGRIHINASKRPQYAIKDIIKRNQNS